MACLRGEKSFKVMNSLDSKHFNKVNSKFLFDRPVENQESKRCNI